MAGPYRIGVVGFGVAGGTSALLLSSADHEVTIMERAPEVGPVGAGILLQPSGQLVLKRLGLLEQVTRSAEPIHNLRAYTHRGKVLIRLAYSDIAAGCHAYGVHRGNLFDVIRRAVNGTSTKLILGCDISGSEESDGDAYLVDRKGARFGPFDFLIIADGAKSTLRSASGIRQRVHTYPYGAIWGVGACAGVREHLFQVVEGTAKLIGLLPIGDGMCTVFISASADEWAGIRDGGYTVWRDGVLRLCPSAQELFDSVASADDLRFTDYRHTRMESWHNGHMVFLGDAAHAMSPHLGQGVNLALMDAESFSAALSVSDNFESACAVHELTRMRHIAFYSRLTYLLSPFFQSGSAILGLGRDIALPLMSRVPWLRRQMACAMGGISQGLFRKCMDIEELIGGGTTDEERAEAFMK